MMENKARYKVAVKCCTYNQASYITDALNGFVIQETNFPFVCCVIDDASTDGEQEVIKKYVADNFNLSEPNIAYETENDDAYITFARHKSNKNCFFAVLYLKRNLYHDDKKKLSLISKWMNDTEYIALCEGDDYWIVPNKLQRQTDFMDSNADCVLVFSNAKVVYDMEYNSQVIDLYAHLHEGKYSGEEVLSRWTIPTASVLFRSSMDIKIPSDVRFVFGDIVIFMTAASCGDLYCINEKMVCYRRNSAGVSMIKQDFTKLFNHYQAISEHFGNRYKTIIVKLQSRCLIWGFLSEHLRKGSWQYLLKAFSNRQLLLSFISQFMSVLKKSI